MSLVFSSVWTSSCSVVSSVWTSSTSVVNTVWMSSTSVVSSLSSRFVVSHWRVSLASFYPSLVSLWIWVKDDWCKRVWSGLLDDTTKTKIIDVEQWRPQLLSIATLYWQYRCLHILSKIFKARHWTTDEQSIKPSLVLKQSWISISA